jgi:hypothetical protein
MHSSMSFRSQRFAAKHRNENAKSCDLLGGLRHARSCGVILSSWRADLIESLPEGETAWALSAMLAE